MGPVPDGPAPRGPGAPKAVPRRPADGTGGSAPGLAIYCRSCESMPELSDGSIALTVTSPPYWNAIDYDRHSEGAGAYYRTRRHAPGVAGYQEYLDWLAGIFGREVLRVTKPGGFCAIVVGTVLERRRHFPVPFDLTARLVRAGWEFHQDIVWHKCTAGVKRAGIAVQYPHPGYFYPNIMTEYVLLFRKPGPVIFAGRPEAEKTRAAFPVNRLFVNEIANNVWHIAPIPPGKIDHPCPFPEEIPYRLIRLYSYPGETVLDPFVGSGQVGKVARALGRSFAGYDTSRTYAEMAHARAADPLRVRPEQLVARFDKVSLDEPLGPTRRRTLRQGSGGGPQMRRRIEGPSAGRRRPSTGR